MEPWLLLDLVEDSACNDGVNTWRLHGSSSSNSNFLCVARLKGGVGPLIIAKRLKRARRNFVAEKQVSGAKIDLLLSFHIE